jgi:predicted transcriptional regulator
VQNCGVCALSRSRLGMVIDVLKVIQENPSTIKLSHLMCKTNINSMVIRDSILSSLLQNGLIEETTLLRRNENQRLIPYKTKHSRVSWRTSEKGRRLLEVYKDLKSLTGAETD